MAKKQHLDLLKQGIATWNAWRIDHQNVRPNLIGAGLNEASLIGANLSSADLAFASLTGATFRGVISVETSKDGTFYRKTYGSRITTSKLDRKWSPHTDTQDVTNARANLSKAILVGANLSGVDLSGAYLNSADLSEANLRSANLSDTDLSEANLSMAVVFGTIFVGVDLLTTKGLTEISIVGHQTLCRDIRNQLRE